MKTVIAIDSLKGSLTSMEVKLPFKESIAITVFIFYLLPYT